MISTNIFNNIEKNKTNSIKQNRIEIKNDEIFYAINSSIRQSKSNADYKLLDTDINFEIENIKFNSSGNLLAVYNSNNLTVLSIDSINVKQYNIAVKLFEKVSIKCLLWNKSAKFDSNLIILSDDNIIRSFDLNYSFNEPLKTFNLANQASNKKGLILNSIRDPTSITFGSTGSKLSGLLTLYIVDGDGDVFSIYPFLPVNEVSATEKQVEDLFNESVLLLNSSLDGENEVNKELAINQLRFVNTLWKQLPLASVEIRESNVKYFISDISKVSFKDTFAIQGPFSIQPYPECLYEDEATDIISFESDGLDLISIAFKQYGFVVLLPDYNLTMKWYDFVNDSSVQEYSNLFTLLKHEKPKSQKPTYFQSSFENTLLIQNDNNLLSVSALLDIPNITTIKPLILNAINYEGNGVIYDVLNNTKTTIILANSTVKFLEEPINNKKLSSKSNEEKIEDVYKSSLNSSVSLEISKLLKNIQSFKLNLPSNFSVLSKHDEDSLAALDSITSSISKNLAYYHKFGILINYKLNNLNIEFQNQITTANAIFEKYNKLRKKNEQISKLVERQEKLNKRFDLLKETVSNSTSKANLALSTKEKKWFKEIALSVSNFNKSLRKNELLKEQLKFIETELNNLEIDNNNNNNDHDEFDWADLNLVLKQGKELLNSTANSLNSNLKDLDSQLNSLNI